jgi:hypothetical protein
MIAAMSVEYRAVNWELKVDRRLLPGVFAGNVVAVLGSWLIDKQGLGAR